jgi:DNA mismatch endonuclease (patch repair protein)
MPKSRLEFWKAKLEGNVERDKRKWRELREAGWTVAVIWECETKDAEKLSALEQEIRELRTRR